MLLFKIHLRLLWQYFILFLFLLPFNPIFASEANQEIIITKSCSCNRISDSLALTNFYFALNGDNWTNTWDLFKPIDTWYGIKLNPENGCVIKIDLDGTVDEGFTYHLSGNKLQGSLPDLINLPALERIELAGNTEITGTIPNFEGMPNLTFLDLRNNTLDGNIPNFQFLPNLEQLILGFNKLEGELPNLSLTTPRLKILSLRNNNLTGEILNFNLPVLEIMDLSYNWLTGSIPNFQHLPNLLELYLINCNLTEGIPNFFDLPNLKILKIRDNANLGGTIPNFFNLPNLREFDCRNCGLSGSIPDFSSIDSLRSLNLAVNTSLKGPIPEFTEITKLTHLYLDGTYIGGIIPNFKNLTSLRVLGFSSCGFSGKIPNWEHLANTIVSIDLFNNDLEDSIPDIFESFKNLTDLNVRRNNLEYIPPFNKIKINFSNAPWAGLNISENQFTFEDLVSIDTNYFITSLEDSIFIDANRYQTQKVINSFTIEGERCSNVWVDLNIDSSVHNNIYTWIKVDNDTIAIDTNSFLVRNLDIGDVYKVLVTNPFFPGLTLKSDLFNVQIDDDKCNRCPQNRDMDISLTKDQICAQENTILHLKAPEGNYSYQAVSDGITLSPNDIASNLTIVAPEKSSFIKVLVQDQLKPTCVLELYDSIFLDVSNINVDTTIKSEALGLSDGLIILCIKDGIGIINIKSNQGILTKETDENCSDFYHISNLISGNYNVTISDEIGCELELDLFVPPNYPRIKLAITPNNDGINDFLFLDLLEGGNYEENTLYIFNNWGKIIHQIHNYHNENNNWSGWVNGKLLPTGNYFFQLNIGDKHSPLKGFFTLKNQ